MSLGLGLCQTDKMDDRGLRELRVSSRAWSRRTMKSELREWDKGERGRGHRERGGPWGAWGCVGAVGGPRGGPCGKQGGCVGLQGGREGLRGDAAGGHLDGGLRPLGFTRQLSLLAFSL